MRTIYVYENKSPTPRIVEVVSQGLPGPRGAAGRDGTTVAITAGFTAGPALSALRMVYVDDADALQYANNDTIDQVRRVIGMTAAAAAIGADVDVVVAGPYEDANWAWDVNGDAGLYLGMNGAIVQGAPTAAVIMRIGTVITATKILLRLGEPILSA